MTDAQQITPNDEPITDSITLEDLRKQLDHLDTMIHDLHQRMAAIGTSTTQICQFLDRHEPALNRALKLFDSKIGPWGWGKNKAADGQHQ